MSLTSIVESGRTLAERIPYSAVALLSRFAVAQVFWRSGQTKVSGFHLHEETFVLFRESVGMPVHQYVIERRVERAKSLLSGTEAPIGQVALDTGFAHQSHFTSRFKQATGRTPWRWRRFAIDHFQNA